MLIPGSGMAVSGWTLDDLRQVEVPAMRGSAIVLQFHGTPDGRHPDRLERFRDHLQAKGFTVITMRDLERRFDLSQPRLR